MTAVPWKSSAQHKAGILAYNHSFSFVVITRDRDGGQVSIDSTGRAIVDYTLSPYDAASVLEGVIAGCQIMRAAGAKRIGTVQAGVEGWERKAGASVNDAEDAAAFEAWLEKVRAAGIAPNWSGLGSAHQMGSNPMGSKPSNSAVDPRGRVWGTEKLYVADASVFPTASGVRPFFPSSAFGSGDAYAFYLGKSNVINNGSLSLHRQVHRRGPCREAGQAVMGKRLEQLASSRCVTWMVQAPSSRTQSAHATLAAGLSHEAGARRRKGRLQPGELGPGVWTSTWRLRAQQIRFASPTNPILRSGDLVLLRLPQLPPSSTDQRGRRS